MEDASLELVARSLGLPAHPRVFLWTVAPLLPCGAETSLFMQYALGISILTLSLTHYTFVVVILSYLEVDSQHYFVRR